MGITVGSYRDPEKRSSAQALLDHPFITGTLKSDGSLLAAPQSRQECLTAPPNEKEEFNSMISYLRMSSIASLS
jgi:hypothetical protein